MPMGQPQGHEREGNAVVIIGGQRYDKFLSLTLKRSVEEGCCSGTVVLSWPGAEQFSMTSMAIPAFSAGADGTILLDDQLAATVIFDTRISKGTPKHYELTLQFRGKACLGVDGGPKHESGQFNRQKAGQIFQQLAQMAGINVIQKGQLNKQIERFIIAEGETIERAGRRVVREQGGLFFENPQGNWVLEDADSFSGASSGGDIVLGRDFTEWMVKFDLSPRYAEYEGIANAIPTEGDGGGGGGGGGREGGGGGGGGGDGGGDKYGKPAENIFHQDQAQIQGFSGQKLLRHLVDGDHDKQSLEKRNKMERLRRNGQACNVTVKMSTWSDRGGTLWDVEKKYHVSIPVDEVDDSCRCTEVTFELTPDSRTATLVLMSEDVFGSGGAMNVLSTSRLIDVPLPKPKPLAAQLGEPTVPQIPPPQEG